MRADIYNDQPTVKWVMEDCDILNLSLQDGKGSYVVPLHFGFEVQNQKLVLYVHGQAKGHRAALIKQNPNIAIDMTTDYHLIVAKKDCLFSASFRSAVGKGTIQELTNPSDKIHGLTVMMHHYVSQMPQPLTEDMVKQVHVWKITLDTVSAKVHQPLPEWRATLKNLGHLVGSDEADATTGASVSNND